MIVRLVGYAWQQWIEHWLRLCVFGVVGYSIAVPRALSLEWMVNDGQNEAVANLISLIGSILVAYLVHYHVTWRGTLDPLPLFSRSNLIRLAVILPGFVVVVSVGLIARFGGQLGLRSIFAASVLTPFWTALLLDTAVGLADYVLHNEVTFKRAEQYAALFWPRLVASYTIVDPTN